MHSLGLVLVLADLLISSSRAAAQDARPGPAFEVDARIAPWSAVELEAWVNGQAEPAGSPVLSGMYVRARGSCGGDVQPMPGVLLTQKPENGQLVVDSAKDLFVGDPSQVDSDWVRVIEGMSNITFTVRCWSGVDGSGPLTETSRSVGAARPTVSLTHAVASDSNGTYVEYQYDVEAWAHPYMTRVQVTLFKLGPDGFGQAIAWPEFGAPPPELYCFGATGTVSIPGPGSYLLTASVEFVTGLEVTARRSFEIAPPEMPPPEE